MKGDRPRVLVVGSFVTDLMFRVKHRPGPGETMLAEDFGMFLGGKGFNQAVGARRLGADVCIVGRVGRDPFGDMFVAKLEQEGICLSGVTRDPEAGTAIATPVVDENGQNSIIAAPRANMRVTPEDVLAVEEQIALADILMLQFEIPLAASRRAAEIARKHGTLVLLDPAPVRHGGQEESRIQNPESRVQNCGDSPQRHEDTKADGETRDQKPETRNQNCGDGFHHQDAKAPSQTEGGRSQSSRTEMPEHSTTRPLDDFYFDYLVPNEIEAHMLTGRMTPEEAAAVLLPETRQGVVISLGEEGALAVDRAALTRFPAHKVNVVDTTGAGDAFRAGLAVRIAEGASLDEAVRFANACGALACTIMGAEPSMPRRDHVERFLTRTEKE
ncbi:MAG TPA: ribokinase [bacterium]|nr:ribokinase [bacterium]